MILHGTLRTDDLHPNSSNPEKKITKKGGWPGPSWPRWKLTHKKIAKGDLSRTRPKKKMQFFSLFEGHEPRENPPESHKTYVRYKHNDEKKIEEGERTKKT